VTRRWALLGLAALAVGLVALFVVRAFSSLPPETQPEGAYVRVAERISGGEERRVFALLDDRAKDACDRLWKARREASNRVDGAYPEPERTRLLEKYKPVAGAESAEEAWDVLAVRRGWIALLRKDLSGVTKVVVDDAGGGEAATIETARGARYPFAKRANGTWGLSLFTAELVDDAWRAERDLEVIQKAAADYERVPTAVGSAGSSR
jgi:hypothetical protein